MSPTTRYRLVIAAMFVAGALWTAWFVTNVPADSWWWLW
jgi:hypothetical protein